MFFFLFTGGYGVNIIIQNDKNDKNESFVSVVELFWIFLFVVS